jgi:hypothetical protein
VENTDFLIGWYTDITNVGSVPATAEEGMNVVMPYYSSGANVTAYLDACQAVGMKVFVEIDRSMVLANNTAGVDAFVATYKSHPAVFAWYLMDEPTLQGMTAAEALTMYNVVKAEDPSHPVAIAFNIDDDISTYMPACDIAMYDEYPAKVNQAEFTGLDAWYLHLQNATAELSGTDEWIPILQAFTTGSSPPHNQYRLPTLKEARYMTYAALQQNATGIFYWARYRSTSTFIDTVIEPLVDQITALGPALNYGVVVGVATLTSGSPAVVKTYLDPVTDAYKSILVNHGSASRNVVLSVPDLTTAREPDGTETDITSGTLAVTLEPYEVRTYELVVMARYQVVAAEGIIYGGANPRYAWQNAVVELTSGEANQFGNKVLSVPPDTPLSDLLAGPHTFTLPESPVVPMRMVGATTSGPPVSGTWLVNDVVFSLNGAIYICVSPGEPGIWLEMGVTSRKELAFAAVASTQDITSTGAVDVDGLSVTFDPGGQPYWLEVWAAVHVVGGAPTTMGVQICDQSNTIITNTLENIDTASAGTQLLIRRRFDASSGGITRKVRANVGSGDTVRFNHAPSGLGSAPYYILATRA